MSKTISGNSIYIEDAQKAPLINFELEGKTTQETRSGKNLFNINATYRANNATVTRNETGFNAVATGGLSRVVFPVSVVSGRTYNISFDYSSSGEEITPYARLRKTNSGGDWISDNAGPFVVGHNSFTLTATSTGDYYIWFYFNSSSTPVINYDVTLTNIQFEEGSTETSYEKFGVQPSPDYPSELVSVGYENIFSGFREISTNGTYENGVLKVSASGGGNCYSNYFIPTGNRTYYFNYISSYATARYYVAEYDSNYTQIRSVSKTAPQSFTIGNDTSYFAIIWNFTTGTTYPITISNMQLEKGASPHSYIPYGKYGLEVKTIGKNLFDGVLEQGSVNSQGINNTNTTRLRTKNYISVYPNTTYTLKVNENTTGKNLQFSISYYDKNDYTTYRLSYLNWTTSNPITFTTPNDCHYIRFLIAYTDSSTINTTDNISKIQVEKTQATTYEPYKENIYTYTLNEPLRAIGNYKDNLYIDNGMLYVERKIGKIIYKGNNEENWAYSSSAERYSIRLTDIALEDWSNTTPVIVKSNYFNGSTWYKIYRETLDNVISSHNITHQIIIKSTEFGSLENFKTWLSTHNTEVNYVLSTSVMEELGEVSIPSTYKGITHIDTTDELEPNMSIEYVNDFSAADKQALQNNTAAIKCKLIVQATDQLPEIELTENNAVKDWTYTDERLVPGKGFIGQFVGRTLEGNLQNISDTFSILNREIKFMFGVYRINDETETWYDFGNFIVTEPENNEVNDNTKFETMDYTKLFNKSFDGDYTDEEYPNSFNALTDPNNENRETVSARWLARYTCKQAGVDLATTSFTNNDFQIDGNPFKAGETCRDVMKAIGQLAFSWVRIGWDNRCYIDFEQGDPNYITTYETIDNDQYFSLKTLETVIPVDGVGFGMKNIDGETALKLATGKTIDTAENIIYLYDNPLLYTFDLRTAAVASADVLFGLTFNQLETETIGHPWLIGSSYINMVDMENNNHYTYAFNNTMKYSGHIRSTINSMYETDVEKTLGYESDLVRNVTDAWIEVNKINGELSAQSKRITDVETGMSDYYTVEQVDDLFVNYEQGFTNIFSRTGGNNKFRNSGLWFEEGSGFEYWTGNVKVATNMDAGSQTSMILQNGTIEQVISGIPNGRYTISFNCKKLVNGATLTVDIDLVSITLGDVDEFEQVVDVTTNLIDFKLTCNVTDGYEVYNLMCNMGDEKTIWSQHQNETRTDTVNISKGITITSTASNATFKANADGIRIENKVNSRVTNFLDDGMETYNAKISGQAEVSGALFTKVGNQTWINGL